MGRLGVREKVLSIRGTRNWLNVLDYSNIKSKISKGHIYNFVYCGLGLIYMELLMKAEGFFFIWTLT